MLVKGYIGYSNQRMPLERWHIGDYTIFIAFRKESIDSALSIFSLYVSFKKSRPSPTTVWLHVVIRTDDYDLKWSKESPSASTAMVKAQARPLLEKHGRGSGRVLPLPPYGSVQRSNTAVTSVVKKELPLGWEIH